jgi:hypothetical protein
MKINKVVVMYHDTGEITHPPSPPDVSTVKGILSSYIFLFFDTPDHYVMRKYSYWYMVCHWCTGVDMDVCQVVTCWMCLGVCVRRSVSGRETSVLCCRVKV